jgi:hypothetical protein
LVLDKSRWRAVVKRVTDFWVPEIRGISWLGTEPLAFEEGLCSKELVNYRTLSHKQFFVFVEFSINSIIYESETSNRKVCDSVNTYSVSNKHVDTF